MALIYPVQADAPEPDDEAEPDFAELAADLSDQWLVEVAVGEEGDDGCFGPLTARAAWDLAVGVDQRRGLESLDGTAHCGGPHYHAASEG